MPPPNASFPAQQSGDSPAERYQAAKRRAAEARTRLGAFKETLSFELDDFQQQACASLDAGRGVLVAAPTGAGKTIVGEFAIYLALDAGLKAFYTTPIKALSNQKYGELAQKYGARNVGLLTGDTNINSRRPGGGDDHRGAAQHALRRVGDPGRPGLCGHG